MKKILYILLFWLIGITCYSNNVIDSENAIPARAGSPYAIPESACNETRNIYPNANSGWRVKNLYYNNKVPTTVFSINREQNLSGYVWRSSPEGWDASIGCPANSHFDAYYDYQAQITLSIIGESALGGSPWRLGTYLGGANCGTVASSPVWAYTESSVNLMNFFIQYPNDWTVDYFDNVDSYSFQGACSLGSYWSLNITPNNPKTITAHIKARLTVSPNVTRAGDVWINVAGSPDQTFIPYNNTVEIDAVASNGWRSYWQGGTPGVTNLSVTVTSPSTYVNNFQPYLTANVVGSGNINVSSGWRTISEVVSLAATADYGWHFNGWSGSITDPNPNSSITMNDPSSITATFGINTWPLTVTVNDPVKGFTTGQGSGTISYNQSCTVYAQPNTGYHFVDWRDGNNNLLTTATNYTFFMPNNAYTVRANFTNNTYNLSRVANNGSWGSVSGDSGTIQFNQACSVTATTNFGHFFINWVDLFNTSVVSLANTYNFNMPARDYNLRANFGEYGKIKLNITPANATWSLLSGDTNIHTGSVNSAFLTSGVYTIKFYPVQYYLTPSNYTTNVFDYLTTTVNINYIMNNTVKTIIPSVPVGGQWRLDISDTNWHNSGQSSLPVPEGSYNILFKNVTNYYSPNSYSVNVVLGPEIVSTSSIYVPYATIKALLVDQNNNILVNTGGWKTVGYDTNWLYSGDISVPVPNGYIDITFRDTRKHFKPNDTQVLVTADTNSTVSKLFTIVGHYTLKEFNFYILNDYNVDNFVSVSITSTPRNINFQVDDIVYLKRSINNNVSRWYDIKNWQGSILGFWDTTNVIVETNYYIYPVVEKRSNMPDKIYYPLKPKL